MARPGNILAELDVADTEAPGEGSEDALLSDKSFDTI
jgi:hypothetical protein